MAFILLAKAGLVRPHCSKCGSKAAQVAPPLEMQTLWPIPGLPYLTCTAAEPLVMLAHATSEPC